MIITTTVLALSPIRVFADAENRTFSIINAADGLADNSAQTITRTFSGRMVISTIGTINFYDGASFTYISAEGSTPYTLSNYTGNYHIYFDKSHHLWLKDSAIVTCVDLLTETFIHDIPPIFESEGVEGNVDDLFVDSLGRIWLVKGDMIYGAKSRYALKLRTDALLQDLGLIKGKLYLFYDDGAADIYSLEEGKGGKIGSTRAYTSAADIRDYPVSTVFLSHEGKLFQIRNGNLRSLLKVYDSADGSWTEILRTPYNLNSMALKDNEVYIACTYGYWTYNLDTKALHHYDTIRMADGRDLVMSVNTLAFDRQGGMWMGTEERGLLYSRPFVPPFKSYTFNEPRGKQLHDALDAVVARQSTGNLGNDNCRLVDSRGWQWYGGMSGLRYKKPGDEEPTRIMRSEGLLNDIVHSIVEDDKHNIWVGTSNGIAAIVINKGEITFVNSYDKNDEIPPETFLDGRAARIAGGIIVMETVDHVVEFSPRDFSTLHSGAMTLKPKFIRLVVNGVAVTAGTEIDGRIIIDRAVSRTTSLSLHHDHNTLSLVFSGLNYFRPLQTYYRVKVSGLQDDWRIYSHYNSEGLVDDQGLLHLPLMGLRPGNYAVQVQASMTPDNWEGDTLEIRVNIERPWWQASFLYILAGIIIISLLLVNIAYYNRNYRLRLRCRAGEQELARRLAGFIEHAESCQNEIQRPRSNDVYGSAPQEGEDDLDPKFVDVLMQLTPHVKSRSLSHERLRETAIANGLSITGLYDLLIANLYRSPRLFTRALCLQKGASLLLSTDFTVEKIAGLSRFESVNFFISSFYHRYGKTPKDYRNDGTI